MSWRNFLFIFTLVNPELIIFVFRHTETIQVTVLSDLMQALRQGLENEQRFILILFQSSVCPLPVKLDTSISSLSVSGAFPAALYPAMH